VCLYIGLELFGSIQIAAFSTAPQQRAGSTLGHGWGERDLSFDSIISWYLGHLYVDRLQKKV
jgi:hypothetical protein